jgi:asparagine synthase (glutamine-hydrolysing)
LKALLANPALERRVDVEALDCYLAFGYVAGERCMLQGVRKLPPAHALIFDAAAGDHRVWAYWQLPEPLAAPPANEPVLLAELEQLLEDAVRRQLVADVPVGVLLSGGIDSSLVTAFAARSRSKLSTFTVRFPGFDRFDETEHARLIARAFNTDHVELEASNPSVTLLPMLAKQFDEPIADSSMVPTYLVSHLTREHCKVALSGDGGDELFAGYPHYPRLLRLERNATRIPRSLRRVVSTIAPAVLPIGFRGRNWTSALADDLERGVPHIGVLFDAKARQRLMSGYGDWKTVAEKVWHDRMPQTGDLLQRATRMDFENFLPDDILVKVDRASMLTSLEIRAPLLDHRIVEFAFGRVPSHLKATLTERKILLKRLAAKLLPREFDFARKQGFSIPLGTFLRSGSWRAFFRDVLNHSESTFDKSVTNELLRGQLKGRANHERLFALVMFELWRQEYGAIV